MEEIIETVDLCSSQQEEEKCWPESTGGSPENEAKRSIMEA